MQKLGRNHGAYHGERIDIRTLLATTATAARRHGWEETTLGHQGEFAVPLFRRRPARAAQRIYISAGIHGDEPAGPMAAARLLEENHWPERAEICLLPCLNPVGFTLNRRENPAGTDLNRDFRAPRTAEIRALVSWLERESGFDLCLCLHEDWEAHGFYLYELNTDSQPSRAEAILAAVRTVCPIDSNEVIEGRPASGGLIRPTVVPRERPDWPEAFYLIENQTRLNYTLEAPSDFPLATRVAALRAGVRGALGLTAV